jgi:hypothetical protein
MTTVGFYVFRPLTGKHKENNLCVLRASAVNFIFFDRRIPSQMIYDNSAKTHFEEVT